MTITAPLPPTPTFDPPTNLLKRWTVDEYHKLIEAGIFDEDDRFELLEGWIVHKVTKNPIHENTIDQLQELLRARLTNYRIRLQSPITTTDSEPEPGITIAEGPATQYKARHPGPQDIPLVIEVADSSLPRDRREKLTIYARAAIPVYWIINLPERVVEVYTDPSGPAIRPTYRRTDKYFPGDALPLAIAGQNLPPIPVGDIFL